MWGGYISGDREGESVANLFKRERVVRVHRHVCVCVCVSEEEETHGR